MEKRNETWKRYMINILIGEYTFSSGDIYDGEWVNDIAEGIGIGIFLIR